MTRRDLVGAALASAAVVGAASGQTPEPAEPAKKRIKQSFTWGTFARGVEPEKLVKEAARVGFASIEMGPQEHWSRIQDAGMTIAIFVGHASLSDGLNDTKNHDRIEKELLKSLDLAEQYKIPSLLVLSGNRRGKTDEEGMDNCVACTKRVIQAAETKKVNLCLELLNSKVNHPDYQCDHSTWGVEVCKRVGSPRMKVLDDLYHMQIMEGDLIRNLRANIGYIGHFHTAGNPGRRDLDETQEVYYPAVMRAIAESGYQGYVGHEFTPKGDSLEAMRKTFDLCNV
ncbi:MAG TPA: TIM barrel protein [Armatimonadota bacterium]|jgi:hydroxypyruvate isomerase